ncbi:unnamed protein product [Sphenostylis stenocarpa]|uniref:Protein kinase domain-containing protein n=1 Tax=Sphenostylis stenocarpa TaxID=92480 RepID=A0AA87BC58_9FABA|nr:unnamed protein product [Sphenostylis stenocarpa]
MSPVYEFVLLLLFSNLLPLLLAAGFPRECPPSFPCGYLGDVSFPFTKAERQDCGFLPIRNCDDPLSHKMIQPQKNGTWFQVIRVTQLLSNPTTPFTTFQFRDEDLYALLQNQSCEAFRSNYTLPHTSPFASFSFAFTTTLVRCNRSLPFNPPTNMCNYTKCHDYNLYFGYNHSSSLTACTEVELPNKDVPDGINPFAFLTADVLIKVELTNECLDCINRQRGLCQLDSRERFYCAKSYASTLLAAGLVVLLVLVCCFWRKIFYPVFWRENPTHRIIENFLKEHGPLPTARYSFLEVQKMTNSFRNKLGQGGFGSVYKGKLPDGSVVAVKILSISKGNGEEFINEVWSISKTSHVNVIRLLGFCFENSRRALIYEFMPNGSLDKFIYEEKNELNDVHQLDWKILNDIAMGIAHGLEYLYRGCNTRIIHFDIKPHNILLDEDFCPKISDFGLAKICARKESLVSIFGARGTAGYVAPEVFSRNFGVVSHKSDVYSYGMMVLEMVGRRKNVNTDVDRSSEIYFPHWIYNRLEGNTELGLENIRNENEEQMVRKMTIVGLWCIQTLPSTRPTISRVFLRTKKQFFEELDIINGGLQIK